MPTQRCKEKREPGPLAPLFMCFSLPPGLPYVNWASRECCLSHLRSPLLSSDLRLFYVRGLFPSLPFSHRHSGLLFPILPAHQFHAVSHSGCTSLCPHQQDTKVPFGLHPRQYLLFVDFLVMAILTGETQLFLSRPQSRAERSLY